MIPPPGRKWRLAVVKPSADADILSFQARRRNPTELLSVSNLPPKVSCSFRTTFQPASENRIWC